MDMEYRRLGRSGLKVSLLSFGSWVTFKNQVDVETAVEQLTVARQYGVNFFDNAEAYAGGESERIMGEAIQKLGWDRGDFVVSSKFFWGLKDGPNSRNTLNRKYLLEAIQPSLDRFQLDHLDLVFCHRSDPDTPVEETVRAMDHLIETGKALYWGTSEWSADEIRAAWDVADRHGWHKPVMEQPEYNLFNRRKVEKEYARLYEDIGLGLTTWSPLASGLLTGKYMDGVPEGSRATVLEWLSDRLTDEQANAKVAELESVADDLDCTLAQLSIAWCASNPNVSTVITGASRVEQIHDNMGALEVIPKLTPEIHERIDAIFPQGKRS